MDLGDRLSEIVLPPRLGNKGNVSWHVLPADVAGGEHDLEIGSQPLRDLGQFSATHAGHTHVGKQNLDPEPAAAPIGFNRRAATEGVRVNGFYLFQNFSAKVGNTGLR